MIRGGIRAMRDRAEIVGARNDPLGQQESRGQLAIRAGRAHDHRERAVVQPDFEGLLGRRAIDLRGALAARHPDDADGAERLGHGHHLTRAMMRQHALDEQPPALRIREPPLVGDRQMRQPRHQCLGEQTACGGARVEPRGRRDCGEGSPNLHALDAAAGRVSLQHAAVEIGIGELLDPPMGVPAHPFCDIASLPGGHERDPAVVGPHEPHRLARRPEAGFHLWTHRHPLDRGTQDLHDPRVTFVSGVVAHRLAQQTGGDADAGAIAHSSDSTHGQEPV